MANSDLITEYLVALRGALLWRANADDLISEIEDHLRCAATGLQATGLDRFAAEHQVIERFGDATTVARSFALTPSGGIAMPTQLTRIAGTFALVGALAWLLALPAALLRVNNMGDGWGAYFTFAVLVFVAAICTTVALFGLLRRAGGGADWLTVTALLVAILGTLMLGMFTWGWPVGALLLTIAALVAILRLRAARFGSGATGWLLVAAWPIGIGLAILLAVLKVGRVDSYGDYTVAHAIGFAVGCTLFAVTLAATGRRLRSEQPADIPGTVAIA